MQNCTLIGNITKDLELKTGGDKSYLKNSIAVQRQFKNKEGEYESDFFNFTIFGSSAEFLANYAKKGSQIALKGEFRNNNYTDKEGRTVYSIDFQVQQVKILGKIEKNNVNQGLDKMDDFLD